MWLRPFEAPLEESSVMTSRLPIAFAVLFAAALLAAPPVAAQAPTASGHWTGVLDTPAQPFDLEIDLKPATPPAWIGTISIPAQNLKAFPLSVEVQGTSVSFTMP